MKKTHICLLSIILLLSTLTPFTASAATGTPISSADEFMAMKSGGEYYLTADITLGATYEQPFEGVLNGNGKSITISAPIFADFSGKVENLTISGEIKATDRDASAFALTSSKGFEAVKCTNNVSVTVTGNAKYVSGFVGLCYNAAVKFTDCVNNGNISLDSTADEKARAGGFGSVIDTLIMSGCVNNGDVYLKGKYSFQYIENATLENCDLDTKDAFWHAKNVTVRNCTVKGEYLGWYCENVTFENCVISGTQPLCYCKGLRLINCEMHGADLSFEKSEVEATVTTPVISVKNPSRGHIALPGVGEIIRTDPDSLCTLKIG